eukprot:6484707-Amphidinium_carterae.1
MQIQADRVYLHSPSGIADHHSTTQRVQHIAISVRSRSPEHWVVPFLLMLEWVHEDGFAKGLESSTVLKVWSFCLGAQQLKSRSWDKRQWLRHSKWFLSWGSVLAVCFGL